MTATKPPPPPPGARCWYCGDKAVRWSVFKHGKPPAARPICGDPDRCVSYLSQHEGRFWGEEVAT